MGSPLMYGGFFAAVLVMVLIDMFALNRAGQHKVSVREALGWSAIWFTIAMLFNGLAVVGISAAILHWRWMRPPAMRWPIRRRWSFLPAT